MTETVETKENAQELPRRTKIVLGVSLGAVFVGLVVAGFLFFPKEKMPWEQDTSLGAEQVQYDKYTTFLLEVFDKIKENYWDKITDEQLANLYGLGIEKLTEQKLEAPPSDRGELAGTLAAQTEKLDSEEKKVLFSAQLADIVLVNLQPFGRSRLYSQQQEADLKNRVENRDPQVDQYAVLGLTKDATLEEIQKSYEEKAAEVRNDQSPEAEQEKQALDRAYLALSDESARKTYDEQGTEPTIESRLLRPEIFYLKIIKISPTMLEELKRVTEKVDQGDQLDTLILDLRDNVGGLIDGLQYFLGPFIGNDQYAYQFYHQGEKKDFKTVFGFLPSLVRYKKVVILINKNTQSSAEVMAATLKKYNVGVLVGEPTKGWGTIEQVFDLENQIVDTQKFSLFLVHEITLRDDGQPIEGRGVDPVINITDPNWKRELSRYFNSQTLVNVVGDLVK